MTSNDESAKRWKLLYRIGGISTFLIIVKFANDCVLGLMVGSFQWDPTSTKDWFELFRNRPVFALFRLSLFDMIWMILLIPFFLSMYASLKTTSRSLAILSMTIGIVGIICYVSGNNSISLLVLSEKYWAAGSEDARRQLSAAAEAVLSLGMGTGVIIGAILVVLSSLLFSITMLMSALYGKLTSIAGILVHTAGVLIIVILSRETLHTMSIPLMALFGLTALLYLLWYASIGVTLIKISRKHVSASTQ
jgi:hypothetical protein